MVVNAAWCFVDLYHHSLQFILQARDGTLAVEDMDGGTFTISNGGVFGSLYGTPIINPPQSAILGMHGVFDRPVAINKQVCETNSLCVHVCLCVYNYVWVCVHVCIEEVK